MLYGLKRAVRKPDARHPFGYAQEIYVWAFVVAILIFAIGAGISLYKGIEKVRHPHEIADVHVNYIVLGLALIFEGVVRFIAPNEFNTARGKRGLLADWLGIALSQYLEMPELDGVASIVIAGILASAAVSLAYETKALLIGEAADPEVVARLKRILAGQQGILRTNETLAMHLGPRDVLVNISPDFHDGPTSVQVEGAITELEKRIKTAHPEVKRVFIEAQSWQRHRLGQQH